VAVLDIHVRRAESVLIAEAALTVAHNPQPP
jgi:hypothetical protein